MLAFVKSKKDFKTVVSAEALNWDVPLASIENDVGTITLLGTAVSRGNEGDFLIMGRHIWIIDRVTPEQAQTRLRVADVHSAFDRKLLYAEGSDSIGAWLAEQLRLNYKELDDTEYAMPYLEIVNSDATEFLAPTVEDCLYDLASYMRKINRLKDVQTKFSINGSKLRLEISKRTRPSHNIVFNDGHCQLLSQSYSRSSIAKVTAFQAGVGTDYYLSASGEISTDVPLDRTDGEWKSIILRDRDNAAERVADTFSQNSKSHRVEWASDRSFELYDTVNIRIDGGVLSSYVSYIGISSTDKRYQYRSGELATTLTEQLRKGATA